MSGKLLQTYAPNKVVLVWSGIPIEGLADNFINVAFNNPKVTQTEGPDGKVARTKHTSYTGTITVTLQQNSPTNQDFTNILALQDAADTEISGPFIVEDPSGGTLYTATDACLSEPTETALGASHEDGTRTWVFLCAGLVPVSGNTLG